MALETASTIAELNASNPVGASDTPASLDDHIRLIKTVLKADALVDADIGVNVAAQSHTHTSAQVSGLVTASGLTQSTAKLLGRTTAGTGAVEEIGISGATLSAGTLTITPPTFSSSAENAAGTVEDKSVDPLGVREAFNATGTAPVYACRAWCNFNGTGTIGTNQTIRASGNIASVYKNGTGDYTITFSTAMPDANFCLTIGASSTTWSGGGNVYGSYSGAAFTTTTARFILRNDTATAADGEAVTFAVFR